MLILAELTPLDKATGSRVPLRAASADDRTITNLDGKRWWPAIKETPRLTMRLFEGDFTSDIDPGGAAMTVLIDKLAKLEPDARRYLWAGAGLKIWGGQSGQPWPWTQLFDGKVVGFEARANRVALRARVNTEPFEKKVLTLTYAGTGGAEGDANLKGKPKPWVFGRAQNVEGVLVNAVDNIYQFSAYGPIQGVTALYERASDYGASVGDFPSYAALLAEAIPAGRWGTCLAEGLVRLGAPAYGLITADIEGDKPGGVWLRKTGEIVARAAASAGVPGDVIDAASLAALDAAVPYPINLVLTDQITVLDLARRLARPCNAQAGVSWLGKLFVCRLAIGASALTLDAQGRRLPGVVSSVEADVSPPYWSVTMGAARAWRVHSPDELAVTAPLVPRGDYSATETYREGNTVYNQGSSWRYVNATPGAGNAPPTLPIDANAYWEVMAARGPAGLNGLTAKSYRLIPQLPQFPADHTGAVAAGTAIRIDLEQQNMSGADLATLTWSASAFNAAGTNLGAAQLRTTYSGAIAATNNSTVYLQIGQVPSATTMSAVVITATITGQNPTTTTITKTKDGAPGLSVAEVTAYQRAALAPSTPSGGSFDFATKVLTPPTGWSATIPAGTNPLYAAKGTASIQGTSGTAVPAWAGVGLQAQNGTNGTNGSNGANGTDGASVDIIFTRSASQPSTPAASAGVPQDWYTDNASVPASALPLWSSFGQRAAGGTTFAWDTPVRVEGTPGNKTVWIYKRAATRPATPTGNGVPSGWSLTPPGPFTPVVSAGITNTGGTAFTKSAAGTWDAGVSSVESFTDGVLSVKVGGAGSNVMVGFNTDPATDNGFASIDYAFQLATGFAAASYTSGSAGPSYAVVAANDVFTFTKTGTSIAVAKNGGAPFHTFTVPAVAFHFDSSFAGAGSTISEVTYTSAAAGSGTGLLWASAVEQTSTGTLVGSWPTPFQVEGSAGLNGVSTGEATLYRRSASAPTLPTQPLTYTFATGLLSGTIDQGWSQTEPAGTDPLYVTKATASSTGATDTIAANEWSSPVVRVGAVLNSAPVTLYQRNGTGTPPAVPSGASTYTFATAVLTGHNNGWTQSVPADSGGKYLFVTTATAVNSAATDTIASSEWAAVRLMAQDGAPGATGNRPKFAWRRSATIPATPTGAGTPSGWSATPPAADGNPLYMATSVQDNAETVLVTAWGAPVKVEGDTGLTFTLSIYAKTVFANYNGTIKDSELPFTITPSLKAGGTVLTGSASISTTTSAATASVGSGVVTVSAVTGNGYVDVRCVYGAFDQTIRVQVTVKADQAPPATSTTPVGGHNTVASSSTFPSVASTTYPSAPTAIITVQADGSGQVQAILNCDYAPARPASGTRGFTLIGKAVYRVAGSGGAWSDFAVEKTGTTSYSAGGTEPDSGYGSLLIDTTKTGLTAAADYECGFLFRKSASGDFTTTPTGLQTFKQPGV